MRFRFLSYLCLFVLLSACASTSVPARPDNVTASAEESGIRVKWEDKSQNELGFSVYREVVGESPDFKRLANVPVDVTSYLDTEVRAGASYRYAVTSRGPDGESARVTQAGEAVKFTAPAPNTPPVANDQSVSTEEDTALTLSLSGSDDDGDTLRYALKTEPQHGSLSGLDALSGTVVYTPEADYTGSDSFGFTVSDGAATSTEATVSIEVSALNDAPVAQPQSLSVAEEAALAITLSATDAEADSLTYAVASPPQSGTLSALDSATGKLSYTPNTDFSGTDSFTFTASDGTLTSSPATISINVSGDNDAPTLEDVADLETGLATRTLSFTVGDPDGGTLTASASSSNGAVLANPLSPTCSATSCTLSLTPAGPGTTTISLSVTDDGGLSASDTFELSVFGVDKLVTNPANSGTGSLRQIIDSLSSGESVGFGTLETSTIDLTTPITTGKSFSLLGPGSAKLTLSGGDTTRILLVEGSAKVTLRDISLARGHTDLDGGCLRVAANATLTLAGDLLIRDCRAGEEGGAVNNAGTLNLTDSSVIRNNKAELGGAINNLGSLTLSGKASIETNEAFDDGGGIYSDEGSVTMSGDARLKSNIASDRGGGIYLLAGSLSMSDNVLITLNRADADGNNGGSGGGVYSKGATLTNVVADANVTANTAGKTPTVTPDQVVTEP